jgi:hypothetical protein
MRIESGEKQKATPADYSDLFERDPRGVLILDDLVARFGGNTYVSGGRKGDRETAYRAGRNAVVQFVLAQINRANGAQEDASEG